MCQIQAATCVHQSGNCHICTMSKLITAITVACTYVTCIHMYNTLHFHLNVDELIILHMHNGVIQAHSIFASKRAPVLYRNI